MSERRRHQRAPLNREAVAYVGNGQAGCRTLDVSVGGIALSSASSQPVGQFARVSWSFAAGKWVDADIVIVRVDQRQNEFVIGASFLRIDAAVTSRIAELVLEHTSADTDPRAGDGPTAVIVPPATPTPLAERPTPAAGQPVTRPSDPASRPT